MKFLNFFRKHNFDLGFEYIMALFIQGKSTGRNLFLVFTPITITFATDTLASVN